MTTKQPERQSSQIFLLFDKIDSDSAKVVCEWIIENNISKIKHPFLTLVVNSEGGDISSAFAIIDMMNSSFIPVNTIGIGEISSSGLMIFTNGVQRSITPNTSIMCHRFSAGFDGKYHELQAITKEYEMINDRMTNHFMARTGMTRKEVEKHLLQGQDVYLSPEKAVEFKLADVISLVDFSKSP